MINPGTSTLLLILAAIVPVAAAAIAGNLATIPNVPTWYAHLIKP
ncbi:MAG: tryptophan-rich sensory protein, partial [Mesorhizobium sp.]